MAEAIRHRGPDDFGFYHDPHAHLSHRRLAVVDVEGGRQPMSNENGSLWITYNGEIYNHATLRTALEAAGHRYKSRSDTETILHSYEENGTECVSHFRGMFAFAIWDAKRQRLFCARDRMGIKPFYYFWDGRVFAFASEIKALIEHPEISPLLAEEKLPEVLAFGFTSGDGTLFRNIRKLMPGYRMLLEVAGGQGELKCEPYWDIQMGGEDLESDARSYILELRRLLEGSVASHLMSDVPLGVLLSGGLDSSAIAALTQRSAGRPVRTFAVGYAETRFTETGAARDTAQALGTRHREVVIGREDFFAALGKLIWHEDEPIAWPSSVPLYFVSKLAAEDVKVALTGEGSDELFGGYERYRWLQVNQTWAARYGRIPEGIRHAIRQWLDASTLLGAGVRRKLRHTVFGRELDFESLFVENFYCAFEGVGALEGYMSYWNRPQDASPLARTLYADQKTYLVELLMKQDQMSMAASLETRVPFLDDSLVEFAARVPDRLKIQGRVQKYLLKAALSDILPRSVLRRKKRGFPTPLTEWLRDPAAEPVLGRLRSRDGLLAEYFDLGEVDRLIQLHRTGREDATDRLWRLLNLQIWGDLFLHGRREDAWAEAVARA